jgi:hypothetical protein
VPVLRRSLRLGSRLGILAGIAFVVLKALGGRRSSERVAAPVTPLRREDWPPFERDPVLDEPAPSTALHTDPEAPAPAPGGVADVAWVEPTGEVCPTTHPVKAKLSSKIFHLPGGQMYERSKPDRCYRDAAAAEADGLRQSQR